MSQYWLAQHVHLCVTDDHVVLLDLKRDKYLGVGPKQMQALAARVKGWPVLPAAAAEPAQAEGMIGKMIAAGMLVTDPATGKEARPVAMPRPEATLTQVDFDRRPQVSLTQLAGFVRASIGARLALRYQPIEAVVERVRRRKAAFVSSWRRRSNGHSVQPVDFDAARAPVEAFLHLRPLLFGARDQCLFDSLALLDFLARRGFFPTWVFGVQTAPFAAHCWVQEGDVVFNDTPDHVRRYAPILTV